MKKIVGYIFLSICFLLVQAQENTERLDEKIDQITYNWDLEADKLSSYEGLQLLCSDPDYKKQILTLLHDIHHYDSVLYGVLTKLARTSNDREIDKTLKDIRKLEEEYSMKSFIAFMSQECKAMNEIEKNADKTANDLGDYSYSGQVYLLETELYKYVKHVTDRVDKIRLHVHHLSKHYY